MDDSPDSTGQQADDLLDSTDQQAAAHRFTRAGKPLER